MTAHVLHKCSEENCVVCEGGLGLCTVCGGAEASLPTECPGVRMDLEVQDDVQSGAYDFVGGRWVSKYPTLDLSQIPPGADWIIGRTNGGLTIHAKVGPMDECFGETAQQALDAAIKQFVGRIETDGLLV